MRLMRRSRHQQQRYQSTNSRPRRLWSLQRLLVQCSLLLGVSYVLALFYFMARGRKSGLTGEDGGSFTALARDVLLLRSSPTPLTVDSGVKSDSKKSNALGKPNKKRTTKMCGTNVTMAILREAFPRKMNVNYGTEGPAPFDETIATFPAWIQQLCPEVVEHFTAFPYFRQIVGDLPTLTSVHAAHSVCTVKMAVQLAASLGTQAYLHAGSHLGAVLHGGPIPWDDDVDLLIPYARNQAFLEACNKLNASLPNMYPDIVEVKCVTMFMTIKLIVVTQDSVRTNYGWEWPFVDVFSFLAEQHKEKIVEKGPQGHRRREDPSVEYFRTHPYYFGGLIVLAPLEDVVSRRYDLSKCILAEWAHRRERLAPKNISKQLDCRELRSVFPFVNKSDGLSPSVVLSNGGPLNSSNKRRLPFASPNVIDLSFARETWGGANMSIALRKAWAKRPQAQGPGLTRRIPNLNVVEVDNDIADPASCSLPLSAKSGASPSRVVEFNAERGRNWLQAVKVLQELDADIIILNEMDIGMARSGQQHTTRLLAHALGMNYAWGLEFVELTRGNQQEQDATEGMENSMGLHGNAILSRCRIVDPLVIRGDDIEPYFSDRPGFINANGYEKRLGGRMVLLARLQGDTIDAAAIGEVKPKRKSLPTTTTITRSVVVGSTHTLNKGKEYGERIRQYIGTSPAIIAGDQDWQFCDRVGLSHVDDPSHHTWPASCNSDGQARGDIICSNMEVVEAEKTIRPCSEDGFGIQATLSDHGITYVSVK